MAGGAGQGRADGEDRARRDGALRRRRGDRVLTAGRLAAAALALLLAACPRRDAPPPAPEPSQPPIAESTLPPSGAPRFEIGPITPRRSDDGREWLVESSVRNTGTRASRDVRVWVEGRDDNGVRLARIEVVPASRELPPGGVTSFVARLPGDAAISTFHVEAIGR